MGSHLVVNLGQVAASAARPRVVTVLDEASSDGDDRILDFGRRSIPRARRTSLQRNRGLLAAPADELDVSPHPGL